MMNTWFVITVFAIAWVSTLSGVALGGFLVFRTKREGYDSLFQVKQPEGQAFNLPDEFTDFQQPEVKTEIPEPVQANADRFTEQFAASLAEKARTT